MNGETTVTDGDFIKFIGTAGARFVTISQARSSGGTWISFQGTNILIDPGPGSLVRCLQSDPALDPSTLDAVIVTHQHIDHSNDINIIIEAITRGGSQKRGTVFLPQEMLSGDSIFLNYARQLPEKIITLEEKKQYMVGSIRFETPLRHRHTVETYGLKFSFGNKTVCFIVDTKYFDGLLSAYASDVLVIYTVFIEPLTGVDHLSVKEAGQIISALRPSKAILTHFGRDVLKAGPDNLTARLSRECGIEVIAAADGMVIGL